MDAESWKKLKDLIFEALQQPAAEREAYLRQRCTDPAMLAEGLTLLKHGETLPKIGASAFPDIAGISGIDDDRDEFADLQPGTRIGPYIIVERLGRGGMGQVFLGRDHELRRKVALKCLLSSGFDHDTERARIRSEARAAAAINHPHVAAVHHVVEHGYRTFIVMEYVEGESLSARMKRGPLGLDRVVAIGRQLAGALQAAHAEGVIHGDLKPANIQITPDGSVKVLDFGIARIVHGTSLSSGMTTTIGPRAQAPARLVGAGTPPYMSPEQLLGEIVDERSDVFSLGVVLFEMTTRQRPFRGTDREEVSASQANGAPRADAVVPGVPRMLADVIAQTLAIAKGQRYQSAVDVDLALQPIQRRLEQSLSGGRDLFVKWLARITVIVPIVILALGMLGAVKLLGFNNNFGRTGVFARFGVEPLSAYFRWGPTGLGGRLIIMTIASVVVMGVRIVARALESAGAVGRAIRRVAGFRRELWVAIGLNNPTTLAQVLSAIGIVLIVGLVWYFYDLINAFQASFNSAPIETLLPMRESAPARGYYQAAFSLVTLLLGVGLFKVVQLRARQRTAGGRGAVALLAGVIAVAILMNDVPYRSFFHRDFERADFAGLRCYIIGDSGDEFLILCPGTTPPRNRAVRRDDPQLQRLGIIENVFRGVSLVRPHPED